MDKKWSFDAPVYLDVNLLEENELASNVETYFDIDHEFIPIGESIPSCLEPTPDSVYLEKCEEEPGRLRRSISADNLLDLENFRKNMRPGHLLDIDSGKRGQPSFAKKSNFQDRINVLAQPKQLAQPKYVSTAEQINKFYGTPTRFHSRQKNVNIPNQQQKPHIMVIPESPALATKFRRREHNVLSKDELEKQQMEEFRRFKIKARPVNPKILRGPIKPVDVPKKPSTIVKPFNLSENLLKKAEGTSENVENYEFRARPVPRAVYARSDSETKLEQKQKQNITMSVSQEKLQTQTVKSTSVDNSCKSNKPTQTLPVPFSFEKRDQQIIKRREALINKVLEEEKQAREFRANPVPKIISKKSASLSNLKTIKSECTSSNPTSQVFKAKPPTVLYQKPFEPKKPERTLVEVTDVCLNTDRRAKEREDFDKKQQEKRERMAAEKLRREIQQSQYEEQEIAMLRKQTIHVAQPVRHYKELKIEPSGKITTPVTPNLKTSERGKVHNKENDRRN